MLGQHTDDILKELLEMDSASIANLRQKKIIR